MGVMHSKNTISFYASQVRMILKTTSIFGLKQLILGPARITCGKSCISDHILASSYERVAKREIPNIGLSDHQLIYCTRKITWVKRGFHKEKNTVL